MRIDLLRHGECVDEVFLRGRRTDSPLSKKGVGQMRRRLIKRRYDRVWTSPQARCRAFAEDWADSHNLQVQVLEDLAERDWGLWDGLTLEAVQRRWPVELEAYLADPFGVTPPQAEPLDGFRRRVQQALRTVALGGGERVLVVTHGGVIKLAAQQVLGFPNHKLFSFGIEYAGLMGVELIGEFMRLEQLEND
jgi:broad specificity phosphatase PhoE